jgi:hypothetical protein
VVGEVNDCWKLTHAERKVIEQLTGGYHGTTPSDWEWKTAGYICRKSQRSQGDREEDQRRKTHEYEERDTQQRGGAEDTETRKREQSIEVWRC